MKRLLTFLIISSLATGVLAEKGLRIESTVYDFGHVGLDYTIQHDFYFVNESDQPMTLDSAKVGCDCSRTFVMDRVVAPGDSGRVRISFETANWYGPNNKHLVAFTSDPNLSQVKLFYISIVGQWFNGISPKPISLFFLPPHKKKSVSIENSKFNRIELALADKLDTLFEVNIIDSVARRGEKVTAEVIPRTTLGGGTYVANMRLLVTGYSDDTTEEYYVTVPVKIVRY